MEVNLQDQESLESFKDSFSSTGSRSNLNFKFLKNLSAEEAGRFFQELLQKIGRSMDDGDLNRILEHVFQWQVVAYDRPGKWEYDQGPFTPLQKPLSESRMALITSSGHFVEGQDPEPFGVKGMTQAEAVRRIGDFLKEEPELSVIPKDTPLENLCVRHGGYDISGALLDPDVAFPLRRLKELEITGAIGELHEEAYSFVGAASQMRILNQAGPRWVKRLSEQRIDAAMMVPLWPVCHVSVGHLARMLEEAGIATVIIAVGSFRSRLEQLRLPRVLLTPNLLGRPVGPPGAVEKQQSILRAGLDLFESAEKGSTIVAYPKSCTFD